MIDYDKHRKVIERLYEDQCTVKVWESFTDPITKITGHKEVTLIENQPCRLSFVDSPVAVGSEGPNKVNQIIKLFIAPELNIPAGSKITVTKQGRTTDYTRSGKPAIYGSHQEIMLELFERYP